MKLHLISCYIQLALKNITINFYSNSLDKAFTRHIILLAFLAIHGTLSMRSIYGTKLKNKNSKKIIKCTTPCSRVVLPMARVSAPMKNDRYIRVIFRLLMPRLRGRLKTMAIVATVGIVSPMLANADPRAKFKLLCNLLALAALTAA